MVGNNVGNRKIRELFAKGSCIFLYYFDEKKTYSLKYT